MHHPFLFHCSTNPSVTATALAHPIRGLSRRGFLLAGLSLVASAVLDGTRSRLFAAPRYTETISVLTAARDREMVTYYEYTAFTRRARAEGYHGVAYLFTALAAAEFIHGQNFDKILVRLGVEIEAAPKRPVRVGSTRENLLKAAATELNSVDTFYPDAISRLEADQVPDAISFTTYAWEAERQHRDIVVKILRWAPDYFERVASKIDDESEHYFICQYCGSTVTELPVGHCPICHQSADHYRHIEPPL